MWGVIGTLLKSLLEGLYGIFRQERARQAEDKAAALEKAVEGVQESLDVEKDVRDAQKKVRRSGSDVEGDDGGLDFGSFNKEEDG
jgi:hypothetical protein